MDVPPLIPMDATAVYLDGNNMTELVNPGFIGRRRVRAVFLNNSAIIRVTNYSFEGMQFSLSLLLSLPPFFSLPPSLFYPLSLFSFPLPPSLCSLSFSIPFSPPLFLSLPLSQLSLSPSSLSLSHSALSLICLLHPSQLSLSSLSSCELSFS